VIKIERRRRKREGEERERSVGVSTTDFLLNSSLLLRSLFKKRISTPTNSLKKVN